MTDFSFSTDFNEDPPDYEHLNELHATKGFPDNMQDRLDLAEYLIAGELEAGPDNGMEADTIESLEIVWDILRSLHEPLSLKKPYYFPTS